MFRNVKWIFIIFSAVLVNASRAQENHKYHDVVLYQIKQSPLWNETKELIHERLAKLKTHGLSSQLPNASITTYLYFEVLLPCRENSLSDFYLNLPKIYSYNTLEDHLAEDILKEQRSIGFDLDYRDILRSYQQQNQNKKNLPSTNGVVLPPPTNYSISDLSGGVIRKIEGGVREAVYYIGCMLSNPPQETLQSLPESNEEERNIILWQHYAEQEAVTKDLFEIIKKYYP